MTKILVAYASKHGSTREIAEAVAEELRNGNLVVDLRETAEVDNVAGYDAVILGNAIYAGNWLPEARRFAERHHAELSRLPVWLFSSGPLPMGADNPQPHDDPDKLAAPLGGVKTRDHRVFVGKIDPDRLGFGERLIAKALRAPLGDFRDWEDIRGWARGIAAELHSEASSIR